METTVSMGYVLSLTAGHFLNATSQVIPRTVLENAKGFAVFTVFKAGFLFSARAGSGIVIAKLPDGCAFPPLPSIVFIDRTLTPRSMVGPERHRDCGSWRRYTGRRRND
jgi:hypothetical protein